MRADTWRPRRPEAGSVVLPVMLLMLLFSAIAVGAALVVRVEVLVQERFRQAAEGLYAAEAGVASAIAELRGIASWTLVLDGSTTSAASQGGVSGGKSVPGGTVLVCCGPGSASDRLARETLASGAHSRRDVRWRPFLWTTLGALLSREALSGIFIVVWVADDEADGDGDPSADSNGIVILRSEAVHPGGLRRVIEAYIARRSPAEDSAADSDGRDGDGTALAAALAVLSWREVR